MAETTKRSTNNSASKSRKSRTDIIRTTLGMYLKQKNYTVSGVSSQPSFGNDSDFTSVNVRAFWICRLFCRPENCELFRWINEVNESIEPNLKRNSK